jgi:hypothetical protein
MICWPWNLVWTLLVHNPLRHMVQFAVVEVRATLDEISSGEFKEIERDLAISEYAPVRPTAACSLADTPERPAAQSQVPRTQPGPMTPPGVAASSSAAAYVPPPLPSPTPTTPAEPDPWLSRADGQPNSTHGGDTAWLQDAWHDTP